MPAGDDRGGHPALHSGPESPARSLRFGAETRETEGSRPPKSCSGAWKEVGKARAAQLSAVSPSWKRQAMTGKNGNGRDEALARLCLACSLQKPEKPESCPSLQPPGLLCPAAFI